MRDGWENGSIVNTGTFYDIFLPIGENFGGPLFFLTIHLLELIQQI